MKYPRILIGAPSSGSGKTMITCGILQVLVNRGLKVSSFKCGPDYIDPMFHSNVIGTKSGNLDTFFTDEETTRYLFTKTASGSQISVLEGVMGYYDGIGGIHTKASTYDVARVTKTPVIFVVNCKGMSLSIVASIKGFLAYKEDNQIQGVILNQISPMVYPRIKEAIERELNIKVFGYVPTLKALTVGSRHLGLVMPTEIEDLTENLNSLAKHLEMTVDIEGLIELSKQAEPLQTAAPVYDKLSKTVRIAVAKDEAFCFLYQDNMDLLNQMGAQLVEFSPIHDRKLPDNIQGIILSGGYPELYARELSENISMKKSISSAIVCNMPCIAECGGFMYLHEQMEDTCGLTYDMSDVIKGKAFKTDRLNRFGYITIYSKRKQILLENPSETIKGHEFHYFDSTSCGDTYIAKKPIDGRTWYCIHGKDNLIAGFPHLYYYSNPKAAYRFLEKCAQWENATK